MNDSKSTGRADGGAAGAAQNEARVRLRLANCACELIAVWTAS
jgi:hypothetical protein